jgi:hypothetical protein
MGKGSTKSPFQSKEVDLDESKDLRETGIPTKSE